MSRRNPDLNPTNKTRWAQRGRETLETITEIPESLKQLIRESLDTPQYGPYHNEGQKMETHLGLMMENIDALIEGTFDFSKIGLSQNITPLVERLITDAILNNRQHMRVYAYLHDIEKPNCMALKFNDKTQKIITLKEWKKILDDFKYDETAIAEYLKARGVRSITYRHEEMLTGGESKDHGPEAHKTIYELAKMDPGIAAFIPGRELLLIGIANHEMHFQVFSESKSAKQFEANFKPFGPEQTAFIFAVCLIDIASSLGFDGNPDYSGFRNMIEAWECYQLVQDYHSKNTLRVEELNALLNAAGHQALLARIKAREAKKAETAKKSLSSVEIEKITANLPAVGLPADKLADFETAIRSDDYIKALTEKGLSKFIGRLKAILK